ncbi:hypothetical protein KC363_g224 [Hortaea werneckii]|nr:hypothetical protein KC363_g224 [Hortaea werneckii]
MIVIRKRIVPSRHIVVELLFPRIGPIMTHLPPFLVLFWSSLTMPVWSEDFEFFMDPLSALLLDSAWSFGLDSKRSSPAPFSPSSSLRRSITLDGIFDRCGAFWRGVLSAALRVPNDSKAAPSGLTAGLTPLDERAVGSEGLRLSEAGPRKVLTFPDEEDASTVQLCFVDNLADEPEGLSWELGAACDFGANQSPKFGRFWRLSSEVLR